MVDPDTGVVIFAPNLAWENVPLQKQLEKKLDLPVFLENDCNVAVIGERWLGAAQGVDDVVCVLAGERIGAGIMVGGTLMRGHEGAAGELSFLGAFEEEHGARGIAQLVRELSGESPEAVFTAAGAGDEEALELVERAERWAGHGIVVADPATVGAGVIGAVEGRLQVHEHRAIAG